VEASTGWRASDEVAFGDFQHLVTHEQATTLKTSFPTYFRIIFNFSVEKPQPILNS
jgi:hypothetical protein